MPIQYRQGDMVKHILSADALDAYAHQCNCFTTMGAGIAKALAAQFPEVKAADDATVTGNEAKLGTFTKAVVTPTSTVYNVYGQYSTSRLVRTTNYPALFSGLRAVMEDMVNNGKSTLGIPFIGCGLAKGNWDEVEPLIKALADHYNITVTVFSLA